MKTYVVGTDQKLLMSTHIVYFHGEIRKISGLLGLRNEIQSCLFGSFQICDHKKIKKFDNLPTKDIKIRSEKNMFIKIKFPD